MPVKHPYRYEAVPFSGCFIWLGPLNKDGYGNVSGRGAHRLAWEQAHGSVPAGKHVLHRCDVRCCVNPEHLFLGDQAENNRDAARKGRTVVEGKPILRQEQRDEIVRRYPYEDEEALAKEFQVTVKHIRRLFRRLFTKSPSSRSD